MPKPRCPVSSQLACLSSSSSLILACSTTVYTSTCPWLCSKALLAAGLVVTAVLGLSILVSYHEKLDSFLAELAAEEGPPPQALPKRPPLAGSLRQISEQGPEFGIPVGKAD